MRVSLIRTAIRVVVLIAILVAKSAAGESFTIDVDRQVNLLPLDLITRTVDDWRGRKPPVTNGALVLSTQGAGSERAVIIVGFNADFNSTEPAIVSYNDYTRGLVIDHDPISVVLRSLSLYHDASAGKRAVAAGCQRNDSAFVARIIPGEDRYELLHLAHGVDQTGDGQWLAGVSSAFVGDYDFDGHEEVFIHVCPARDKHPRVLFCVDPSSLTIEWSLPLAGPISPSDFYACGDSAEPSAVFVTYNFKNGVSDAAFDDYFCYLVKLGPGGTIRHRSIVSVEHGVRGLWRAREKDEFFLFHSLPMLPREDTSALPESRYQLSRLNAELEPVVTVDVDERLVDGWLMPVTGDTVPRFHALTGSGRVLVFDDSLRLIRRSNETNLKCLKARSVLARCSEPCLVFRSSRGLDVYSESWRLLGTAPVEFESIEPLTTDRNGAVQRWLVSGANFASTVEVRRKALLDYVRIIFWEWQDAIIAALALTLLALVLINARRRLADRRVVARERMLQAIINNLQDGFYRADLDGIIIWGSPSAARMLGYKPEEIVGRRVEDFYEDSSRRTELRDRLARDGSVSNWEVRLRRKDGTVFTVSTNSAFFRDERGRVAGVEGIFRDITALKKAGEELKSERDFVRSLLETANSLILGLDRRARIVIFNNELAAVTGYTQAEVLGESWPDLFLPPEVIPPTLKDFEAHVKASPRDRYEGPLITRSGEIRTILWSTSALFDDSGRLSMAISVGQDITERKKAEETARAAHVELEQVFHTAAPMCVIDTDYRIIRVNDTYLELFEIERGEEIGKKCYEDWPGPLCHTPLCPLTQILEGKESYEYEIDNKLRSGRVVTTVVTAGPFRDASGKILGIVESYADITARKRAELTLRANEEFTRAIIEHSPLGISVRDPRGRLLSANDAWKRIWGRSEENVREDMSRPREELRFDERDNYLGEWQREVRRIYEEGGYLYIPAAPRQRPSGVDGWVSQYFYAIKDDRGRVDRVVILTEDITDRREAEIALSASERTARSILDAVTESMMLFNVADFTIAAANETAARRLNMPLEKLVGARIDDVVHRALGDDSYRSRVATAWDVVRTGQPMRLADQRGGRWWDQVYYPVVDSEGRVVQVALFAQDVTEHRNADMALKQSEEKYRLVVENVLAGIGIVKRDGRIVFLNRHVAGAHGLDQEDVANHTLAELFDEATAEGMLAAVARAVDTGEVQLEHFDLDTPDKRRFVAMYFHPFVDPSGVIDASLLIAHDLTDARIAEDARRESEETARAIVNAATESIFLFDINETILDVNETAAARMACHREDLIGKTLNDMVPRMMNPSLAESRRARFHEVQRTGGPVRFEDEREGRWFQTTMYPVLDDSGKVTRVALFSTDITERKKAQQAREAAAQERYDQVRRIAGGVAHEIYNALFPATSSLDLLRDRLTQPGPAGAERALRLIELSENAVRRAIALTELVTRFSSLEAQRSADSVNLSDLMREIIEANRHRIEQMGVAMNVTIGAGLAAIGNRIHLYSLFNNLLLNALDALEEVSDRRITVAAEATGNRVRIRFADSGPGVAEEHREHIFKAFYSTKPTSGTGLGLAMVQKIAQMYGGDVTLESQIDTGAEFVILLRSDTTSNNQP